jgi:tetratricopeptide (TPR) repeat protein
VIRSLDLSRWINRISALSLAVSMLGCATLAPTVGDSKFDSKAAEKSRPFLAHHYGLDFRLQVTGGICAAPKSGADWKLWVQAAGSCVQKQDWQQVEKLAVEMSSRQMDSPWGAYFLGVAAVQRGEKLRAHWMFDLAEKKAGAPIGLVHYERARLIELQDGTAAAAKEMKVAVQADPTLTPAFLWLAKIHHRDRMNSEAEKYYRSVLALRSDSYPALAGLGDIMIEGQKGVEAAELLNRAIVLKPEVAESRSKLANVYETLLKDPAKALQTLRELRVAIEKGRARGRVGYDIGAKIKMIEQTMKPEVPTGQAREREPAQEKKKGG